MKKISIVSIIAILIDQLIKIVISLNVDYLDSVKVVPGFFNITNVHNTGAAWSMFSGKQIVLIFIAIVVIAAIYLFFIKGKNLSNIEKVIYGLLIGGICGNLIDRIIFNYVIDYLEFIFGDYHYPVFNFADILIVISVLLLIFLSFKEDLCKKSK